MFRRPNIVNCSSGVMWPPKDQLTKDDYDLQWGVNIVAPFLLTKLLMPALIAGIRSSYDGKARVVTTSSMGAYFDVIHWNTFRPGPDRDKLSIESLYYQSKHVSTTILSGRSCFTTIKLPLTRPSSFSLESWRGVTVTWGSSLRPVTQAISTLNF